MSGQLIWRVLAVFVLCVSGNPLQAAITDNLLLHFSFDDADFDGTVVRDASGNGNDGTVVGTAVVTGVPGVYKQAFQFPGNGTRNCVQVAAGVAPTGAAPRTFCVWFSLEAMKTQSKMFGYGQRSAGNAMDVAVEAGGIRIYHWGGNVLYGGGFDFGGTDVGFYHVAVRVNEGAQTFEDVDVFLNGQLLSIDSGASTVAINTLDSPLVIGCGENNANYTGLIDDFYLYDRALTQEEIERIMIGKPVGPAFDPVPADGTTDVGRDVTLQWTPGEFAAPVNGHRVYFGTDLDEVTNGSDAVAQNAASYTPSEPLGFGQTYYWRVDEVNGPPDYSVYKGSVWSFTIEPIAYTIEDVTATSNAKSSAGEGPENTVNGSGLNDQGEHSIEAGDMWLASGGGEPVWIEYAFDRVYKLHEMQVWNYNVQFELVLGFGLKDVTVTYSTDGVDWRVLGDVELAQGTAAASYNANTTIDLEGVPARYVRLMVNSGWGPMGQYGLSEVRFTQIPAFAREPEPADGAANIHPETSLEWRAGREAVSHNVYIDPDPNVLALTASVDVASFTPGNLEFGKTYYWRVDEVNEADETSVWAGDLWTFSTLEYVLVDGFEEYDDDIDAGTTIFDTWIDGWINNNGSTVGYFDAPFAEKTIVRTGRQSMPLQYDNTALPFYSEAERTFDAAQNWSNYGADTLVVYFQGVPGAFAELPSGKIVMGAAGADIWNAADEFRFACKPLNGDGSIVAYVESVANTNAWAKGGVMIRETLDAGSTFAAVYSTPGNGCRYQARLTTDVAAVSDTSVATAEQTALSAPHWVKIERMGNDFNGYYSTDGENWTSMSWNPQTIAMTPNVYIGLALTSHAAGVLAGAEFSQVTATGNVTGQWAVETIGPAQPEGNSAGQLYVTLEDAVGKSATAVHPAGEAAVLLSGWNEWAIPFSEFTGVNMSRVEVMKIGVGNPTSPTAGGTGIIYVDDIGFGRSAQTN